MMDLFCTILEFFYTIFLYCSLLNFKIKINRYVSLLFIYLLPDILTLFFHIQIQDELDFILCILIWILFIKMYFHIDIVTSICVLAVDYIIIIALQFTFVVINTYIIHLNTQTTLPIAGSIYTLIISVLLYHYINLNRPFSFLFENGKIGKFIMINFCTIAIVMRFYFNAGLTTYYEHLLYIIVAVAILIIFNLLLSNQLGKLKQQEEQLKSYHEYLPVLNDLIQTVRIRQHNYNNQLQAITGLMYTHKDYDSLTTALKEQFKLATTLDVPEYLLKLNMPVVAGFLFQKANEAKRNSRAISYTFTTYDLRSKVPEYILIEMFGILIDNALEAVPQNSTVYIAVDSNNEQIIFTTRNAGHILSPEDRQNFFTKGYTHKMSPKQHSGLGLYQLNRLLKNYPSSDISLWNESTDILFEIRV